MHKGFFEGTAILVGMIIGAGVFTLPYQSLQAGVIPTLILLALVSILVAYIHLLYGELALRTEEPLGLPGYAGLYLGKGAKRFVLLTTLLTFSISLLILLLLASEFLTTLLGQLGVNLAGPWIFTILWLVISFITLYDSRLAVKINFWLSFILVAIFIFISFKSFPVIQTPNLYQFKWLGFLLPYGAIFYAINGLAAVPESLQTARIHKLPISKFKKIIMWGTAIPALVYALFIVSVVGVTGLATTPIATEGLSAILGPKIVILGAVLGLLAVSTTYVTFGMYLKHLFVSDFKFTRVISQSLILFTPFVLYFTGLRNFILAISFMGALLGGAEGIVILLAANRAKKMNCSRKPEYTMPLPKWLLIILIIALTSGAVMEVAKVLKEIVVGWA
jgi:amino acid permease